MIYVYVAIMYICVVFLFMFVYIKHIYIYALLFDTAWGLGLKRLLQIRVGFGSAERNKWYRYGVP